MQGNLDWCICNHQGAFQVAQAPVLVGGSAGGLAEGWVAEAPVVMASALVARPVAVVVEGSEAALVAALVVALVGEAMELGCLLQEARFAGIDQ